MAESGACAACRRECVGERRLGTRTWSGGLSFRPFRGRWYSSTGVAQSSPIRGLKARVGPRSHVSEAPAKGGVAAEG